MRWSGKCLDPIARTTGRCCGEPSERTPKDFFIVEKLQRGYQARRTVLRHALVKVSMGPGRRRDPAEPTRPGTVSRRWGQHF